MRAEGKQAFLESNHKLGLRESLWISSAGIMISGNIPEELKALLCPGRISRIHSLFNIRSELQLNLFYTLRYFLLLLVCGEAPVLV